MNGEVTYRPMPLSSAPRLAFWCGAPAPRARLADSALERARISAWETEGGALGTESRLFQVLAAARSLRESSPVAAAPCDVFSRPSEDVLAAARLAWERRRAFRRGPQGLQ
jgi:hypothetical protein